MSFITGKYVHQIRSWMIGVPLPREEMTWARRLDKAGIRSTMLGKMDFCGEYQDGGFSSHRIIRRRKAWDSFPRREPYPARLPGYTRADKRRHLLLAGARTGGIASDGDFTGEIDERIGNYDHDRIVTSWAVEYLRERGKDGGRRAWALYVGLIMPHWPFCVPEPYFSEYFPSRVEMPFDCRVPNERLHPAVRQFQDSLDLGEVTEDMLRRTIAAYSGMITCVDAMVGEILRELESQGFADNTYVVYTSDHGESLGEHGLFYKQCAYEGSAGVPLILAGPKVPAGGRVEHPVSLVDMYPTIVEMAGLRAERDRPGHSWLRLVRGEKQDRPDYAFSEFHGNFFRHDWYMLVRGNHKYVYYVDERPSLFDVERDPMEITDLAGDPSCRAVLDDFERILRGILDPEEVAFRAKRDLGLIGADGTDYTATKPREATEG